MDVSGCSSTVPMNAAWGLKWSYSPVPAPLPPHTHTHTCTTQINDVGFEAVRDPASGQLLFNVGVGGLFSIKRNMMSLPLNCAVTEEQLTPFSVALLRVFR